MTEAEWLTCTDPRAMLDFLSLGASDRKSKLFAAAAFRWLAGLLPDSRQQRGILLLEEMAEGTVNLVEVVGRVAGEVRRAWPCSPEITAKTIAVDDPSLVGLMLYRAIVSSHGGRRVTRTPRHPVDGAASHAALASGGLADGTQTRQAHSCLLRDIFGNPTRPVSMRPSWRTPAVVSLAQAIYEERTFERMPELSNTLFLAGCDDVGILAHRRESVPHVRGCWVVDLVLGKT